MCSITRYLCSFHIEETKDQNVNQTEAIQTALMSSNSSDIIPVDIDFRDICKMSRHNIEGTLKWCILYIFWPFFLDPPMCPENITLTVHGEFYWIDTAPNEIQTMRCTKPESERAKRLWYDWNICWGVLFSDVVSGWFHCDSSWGQKLPNCLAKADSLSVASTKHLVESSSDKHFKPVHHLSWRDQVWLDLFISSSRNKLDFWLPKDVGAWRQAWWSIRHTAAVSNLNSFGLFVNSRKYCLIHKCLFCSCDFSLFSKLDIETDTTSWAPPNMTKCEPIMTISDLDNINVTTGEMSPSLGFSKYVRLKVRQRRAGGSIALVSTHRWPNLLCSARQCGWRRRPDPGDRGR